MEEKISGIHHITALASDPQKNYDFYTGILGLRFIKKTVNFDAPDVYHFYYGDDKGSPGTILTFFPFPDARRGKRGSGEISSVAFSIPSNSLGYWMNRFAEKAVVFSGLMERFGCKFFSLLDPDGMLIEIFEDDSVNDSSGWDNCDVPKEHSIRKFYGATFNLSRITKTKELLTKTMGMKNIESNGNITRFETGADFSRVFVDVIERPHDEFGRSGAGSVHHIAWRTSNDEEQLNWQRKIKEHGLYPTEVVDRNYFHSIYFREPGGILFEIATDPPGFLIDEPYESLGSELKLPGWYENRREQIEKLLIPIKQKNARHIKNN